MLAINWLRSRVVDSSVKDEIKGKIGSIKSKLGLNKEESAQYGQMEFNEDNPDVSVDGIPRFQKKKTYKGGLTTYFTKRYTLAWMSNLGFIILFAMRCNLSVAMTGMNHLEMLEKASRKNESYINENMLLYTEDNRKHGANKTLISLTEDHRTYNSKLAEISKALARTTRSLDKKKESNPIKDPLHLYGHKIDTNGLPLWTSSIRAGVDSSFFYGYLVTQIPGGIIASRYPANKIFGLAVGASSLLNLFLPKMVEFHWSGVVLVKILQGLVEGTAYPACHGIWRHWAPPLERTRLATISLCGSYAGAVFGLSISGWLASFSWVIPFYVSSVIGLLWFVLWWFTTYESPAKHPHISIEELEYIESSIGENKNVVEKNVIVPWKAFFTSMPVYAIIVANIARSWTFYLLIMKTLKYFSEVHNSSLTESGIESSSPHLLMAIIVPIGGQMADRLRKKRMSTTNVRKLFNCGGFGLEGLFLYALASANTKFSAIVFMNLAVGFSGFAISGYNVNHLDIAPRFASILMGLSNGMGTLSGMICPSVTELITKNHDKASWSKVFIIAGTVHMVGIIFYGIFASGEKQPWADPPEEFEQTMPSDQSQQQYLVSDPSRHPQDSQMSTYQIPKNDSVNSGAYGYADESFDTNSAQQPAGYQSVDPFSATQQQAYYMQQQQKSEQAYQPDPSQNYNYGY